MSMPDSYGQQPQQSQPPQMPPPPGQQPQMPQPGMPYQPYPAGPEINSKAVAAMVCGMIFMTSPLGLIGLFMGRAAAREIDAGMGIGRPLAKAGRIFGWISLAFTIFWILYIILIITLGVAAFNSAT
ncbi:DUF4190 domain-containing protein [Glycomyces buryatensis]|nr:DUF4190 domain-containing protein [Glycomyces buryatensis]